MPGIIRKSAIGLTVALLFFVVVEGILAVAGVTPLRDRRDPYVGFAGYAPLFVEAAGPDGGRVYRTADAKFDWFNRQEFPARKAPGVRRAFCLGGSTTYGRPYDDATSFCGWLREFLPAADPGRGWEVVNAGGISYASYRVVRVMRELTAREPDLFVVYTGHNEFLERRTYDRLLNTPGFILDAGSLASGLRLYSALSDVVFPARDVLDSRIDNILDESVGPDAYHRDDELRRGVLEHYRLSLERMVELARESGAQLVFVTPASNLRDFSPFKAEPDPGLDAATVARLVGLRESIDQHLGAGDARAAAALAEEGLALDPRNADLLFRQGRALLALGRIEEARAALVAARDEDVAPLRALSEEARIVSEVASGASSGLVDFVAMMDEAAPDGIPGDESFLDHVHPTIEANRLLALAIVEELTRSGLVSPGPGWNDEVIQAISRRVEGSVDDAANARALANVARVLSWAGKQDEALGLARRATSVARDPHALYQMLTVLIRNGRHDEALSYADEAARLMPGVAEVRKMNGVILSENGRSEEALRELEVAARLEPTLPAVHYHLGVVLSDLGQVGRAEAAYRTALEVEPANADALNNLGILLARRGDVAGAKELFERAVEANPRHPDAMQNLERARRMLGG